MSEEKLDSNVNDTPKENSAAPEQQEKSFDDNVEIIMTLMTKLQSKILTITNENRQRKKSHLI